MLLSVKERENMECCDIVRNFLETKRGKQVKVLIEGGGFRPVSGKLVDFDESAVVLEQNDGSQYLFDIDYVISVADESEEG
jgi:hypothetical protein